jgi:hypothetical protein
MNSVGTKTETARFPLMARRLMLGRARVQAGVLCCPAQALAVYSQSAVDSMLLRLRRADQAIRTPIGAPTFKPERL